MIIWAIIIWTIICYHFVNRKDCKEAIKISGIILTILVAICMIANICSMTSHDTANYDNVTEACDSVAVVCDSMPVDYYYDF